MKLIESSFFKKYLLPGFIFQSVVIAGGYGTGREIIEYFLAYGPLGGLLGMVLISTVLWSVILAITFEFSRMFKAYDYRSFFKNLLGRYWVVFEVLYLIGMLLVLGVIGATAGSLIRDNFDIPYIVGVLLMMAAIGFLTFKGSRIIEKFLAGWSLLLYLVYAIIFVIALYKFGPVIKQNFATGEILPGWWQRGFYYAFYNFTVIPAVLFCIHHIETRKEAISAGLLAGLIGILPGFLFYVAIVSQYPQVVSEENPIEIPMVFMLNNIGLPVITIIFQIVLFGTLIETGTGFIHAFNERIRSAYDSAGKEFPSYLRPLVAVVLLLLGLGASLFGLVTLIAKGYLYLGWGIFFVFIVPLFTIGISKLRKAA